MAKLIPTSPENIEAFSWKVGEDWEEYFKRSVDRLDAIRAQRKPGSLINAIISFPVADGQALYRVASVRSLALEHLPSGDGYAIPDAHIRGLLLGDIEYMVKMEDWWRSKADGLR